MNAIYKVSDEYKHSAAHVLAAAVLRVFPEAKVGIGPVTKEGFYYDFDLPKKLTTSDISKIEGEINQIILENISFQQKIMSREEALNFLLTRGQIYKAELVNSISDSEISFFSLGDLFTDLCRGPHVSSTSMLGPIIITKTEESYWNEDVRRPRLQRIYGMVFNTLEDHEKYKKFKQEEKVREYINIINNKGLGRVLDKKESIYVLGEDLSILYSKIERQIESSIAAITDRPIQIQPIYPNEALMQKDIFSIYGLKERTYKEMPFSFYYKTFLEETTLGKNKASGLNLDSQGFSIFTTPANLQIEQLITNVLSLLTKLELQVIEAQVECEDLSDTILTQISGVFQKKLISHDKVVVKNTTGIKIRFNVKDYFGNPWAICEVAIAVSPELNYVSKQKNRELTAVVAFNISVHGLLRYLLEKYYGRFPKELVPYQVVSIPINKKYNENTIQITEYLFSHGLSARTDLRAKSLKAKIKDAENKGIPVMIFIGEKEVASNSVSIRYDSTNIGLVSIEHLIQSITTFLNK